MSDTQITEGSVLWAPSEADIAGSGLKAYMDFLSRSRGLSFGSYQELWAWSVDQISDFWASIVEFFNVPSEGSAEPVLTGTVMPEVRWFPNLKLNIAEQVLRNSTPDRPAIIACNEADAPREISWADLERDVGALAATFRRAGIVAGDRIVSYLPNRPETVAAFLACASIGAVWSSCAPEMGMHVVLDRFSQIEPKLILATDSYQYAGKLHDRSAAVAEILASLPSVRTVIHLPGPAARGAPPWRDCLSWEAAIREPAALQIDRVPFEHPLWIVYSSGTTGLPKAMVHGHGGAVFTLLRTLMLHADLRAGDRHMLLASTGWIVWNVQVGGLLCGATIVLYDGHPTYPSLDHLWDTVDTQRVSMFGCGAALLTGAMKDGQRPGATRKFEALRSLISAGSPLPIEAFGWVYREIKSDLCLSAPSGGTDIITSFVSSAPLLPVTAGEIQCAELGVAIYAFDDAGKPVVGEVGELVVTKPMPSMPLYFWNDPKGERYRDSYFDMYPGYWRHGDWIRFTDRGACVIYGRSDTTINRFGIRMGTAEIYRVVEEIEEIRDSLVVDLEYRGRPSFMPLFVVLSPGAVLDEALKSRIIQQIKRFASPRHAPDDIVAVPEIPRTLTGKKMELPVRKLLLGAKAQDVASPDAMTNPHSFAAFIDYAQARQAALDTSSAQ